MPSTTSPLGFPYPDGIDPFGLQAAIESLAQSINDQRAHPGVESFEYMNSSQFDPDNTPSSPDWRFLHILIIGSGGGGGTADVTGPGEISASGGGGQGAFNQVWAARSTITGPIDVVIGQQGTPDQDGGASFVSNGGITFTAASGGLAGDPGPATTGIAQAGGGAGGLSFSPGHAGQDGTAGYVQNGIITTVGHGGGGVRPFTSGTGAPGRTPNQSNQPGAGGSGGFNYNDVGSISQGGHGARGVIYVVVVF